RPPRRDSSRCRCLSLSQAKDTRLTVGGPMKLCKAVALAAAVLCLAATAAAVAGEEPEAVYAKFHAASLAADYDTLRKYGTVAKDADWMPAVVTKELLWFVEQALA